MEKDIDNIAIILSEETSMKVDTFMDKTRTLFEQLGLTKNSDAKRFVHDMHILAIMFYWLVDKGEYKRGAYIASQIEVETHAFTASMRAKGLISNDAADTMDDNISRSVAKKKDELWDKAHHKD